MYLVKDVIFDKDNIIQQHIEGDLHKIVNSKLKKGLAAKNILLLVCWQVQVVYIAITGRYHFSSNTTWLHKIETYNKEQLVTYSLWHTVCDIL